MRATVTAPSRTANGGEGTPTAVKPAREHFISELHGLRGLALALVVAFHLFGAGRVSGGVDVFFVVSAFLVTASLVRNPPRRGLRDLATRYARIFSRLVPAALLVLVAVALTVPLIYPRLSWISTYREIAASALYVENIELANSHLSYGAAGPFTSALQHFWSLSIQGQFFLLWPLVALACWLVARKWFEGRLRGPLAAVTVALTATSFAYAVYLVNVNQPVAYFSSFARLWEFGVGALAALYIGHHRVRGPLGTALPWLGVAMIVATGFVVDGLHTFPGPEALLPVAAVILILVGSGGTSRFRLEHAITVRPMVGLANVSYALYLWHWPVLIAYLTYRGYDHVGLLGATGVLAVSLVLAILTTRFAKWSLARLTHSAARPWRSMVVLVLLVGAVAGAAAGFARHLEAQRTASLAELSAPSALHPGAAVLADGLTDDGPARMDFRPQTADAAADKPDLIYTDPCNPEDWVTGDEVVSCGDTDSEGSARKTIVMTGGSHAQQWYTAMELIAEREEWDLIVVNKSSCRLQSAGADFFGTDSCLSWNQKALDVIESFEPDAVFTVSTNTPPRTPVETVGPAEVDAWNSLHGAGIPVIAMRDTPRFDWNVPECLEKNPGDRERCAVDRDVAMLPVNPVDTTMGLPADLVSMDLSDYICEPTVCNPIVGNVMVYRDDDHLTATYVRSLAPMLDAQLRAEAPWLYR
ncbi:acyltransferase family protein [Demequina aurantiaca]|uniref:acyltransferase family protein n=1 Tax=Demequina aurantiaca TaxID=676200 RepID=UPI003D3253C5